MNEHPKHYCGVLGIFGALSQVAPMIAQGLFALQHRGQEGTGIVTTDGLRFSEHRAMGLVAQAYPNEILRTLEGTNGIGHNRYSTTGESAPKNVQPLLIECQRGPIALGHNGNLINAVRLRSRLEQEGAVFQTTTDSEVMLHLLARCAGTMEGAVESMMRQVQGAYSLVILTRDELIGVRDPHGFRPLVMGTLPDGATVLASETCALDVIGAKFVREIKPGEIVTISKRGIESCQMELGARPALCVFEHVYFARPDSLVENGVSVAELRIAMGEVLAEEHPVHADVVVPVPDGGIYAALGYAETLGIPLQFALVRNHFAGRSFMHPTQAGRDAAAKAKLNLIPSFVQGKSVVVIDDSMVRGTVMREKAAQLRQAGAIEVHIRISCPPHRYACHYGIDFPDETALIATGRNTEAICKMIGADSIGYLSEAGLVKAVGTNDLCLACFNGRYPVT